MSKTYTQTKAHALLLANDANFDSTQADSILDEMYQRYWKTFLKDRVKVIGNFVTFAENDYLKANTVAAREILALTVNSTSTATGSAPRGAISRDEYDAVCADSEAAAVAGVTGDAARWAAYKNQGDDYWHIAIFPPSVGATFQAEILPAYTTPSAGTALEGDDVDAFNVARLAAIEIMVRNGDDPADIQQVWAPLEQAIKDKFQYILERGRPNEHPQKEQV